MVNDPHQTSQRPFLNFLKRFIPIRKTGPSSLSRQDLDPDKVEIVNIDTDEEIAARREKRRTALKQAGQVIVPAILGSGAGAGVTKLVDEQEISALKDKLNHMNDKTDKLLTDIDRINNSEKSPGLKQQEINKAIEGYYVSEMVEQETTRAPQTSAQGLLSNVKNSGRQSR